MKEKYFTVKEIARVRKCSYTSALNFVKKKAKYEKIGCQYLVREINFYKALGLHKKRTLYSEAI